MALSNRAASDASTRSDPTMPTASDDANVSVVTHSASDSMTTEPMTKAIGRARSRPHTSRTRPRLVATASSSASTLRSASVRITSSLASHIARSSRARAAARDVPAGTDAYSAPRPGVWGDVCPGDSWADGREHRRRRGHRRARAWIVPVGRRCRVADRRHGVQPVGARGGVKRLVPRRRRRLLAPGQVRAARRSCRTRRLGGGRTRHGGRRRPCPRRRRDRRRDGRGRARPPGRQPAGHGLARCVRGRVRQRRAAPVRGPTRGRVRTGDGARPRRAGGRPPYLDITLDLLKCLLSGRVGEASRIIDVVLPTVGRPTLWPLVASLVASPVAAHVYVVDARRDGLPLQVPGATVLRGPGRGPAAARNVGWRASTVEWVAFVDDDVVLGPRWHDDLADDIGRAGPDVAATFGRIRVPLPAERRPTDWERNVSGLERACWATADAAYRRAALEAVGGFDERFPRAYRED